MKFLFVATMNESCIFLLLFFYYPLSATNLTGTLIWRNNGSQWSDDVLVAGDVE